MRTNVTKEQLQKALDLTNKEFDNNITFNRFPEYVSYNNLLNFTLKVKDSKLKGAGRGDFHYLNKDGSRKKRINACWHVHGTFFDNLFKVNSEAYVYCGEKKITKQYGNWEDRNIGSMMHPLMFSEACECD